MTKQEVVELMESSGNKDEWDANCDIVKNACGGYPDFWYSAIVLSGVAGGVAAKWGGDDKIHIYVGR